MFFLLSIRHTIFCESSFEKSAFVVAFVQKLNPLYCASRKYGNELIVSPHQLRSHMKDRGIERKMRIAQRTKTKSELEIYAEKSATTRVIRVEWEEGLQIRESSRLWT